MFIVYSENYDIPAEFEYLIDAIGFVDEYCVNGCVCLISDDGTYDTPVWPEP